MGQQFFINSQELESKVRQLLPSQGGAGAGFDLSASTQIVPIVDLTETAEGSNVRADLQTALSLNSVTHTSTNNTTATVINNTGYFRVFGTVNILGNGNATIQVTDGTTTKVLFNVNGSPGAVENPIYDFIVFLPAGVSVTQTSSSTLIILNSSTRQIADISGNLVNP